MSDSPLDAGQVVSFEGTTPILRVADVAASVDYYTQVLGFHVDWAEPGFVSVSRGRCCLFLSQDDQGHRGGWAYVGVSDVDALYAEYRLRGARIWNPPTNFPWGYEVHVADPDNNVLRFGASRKAQGPTGRWRDMHGQLWLQQPDGRWVRAEGV